MSQPPRRSSHQAGFTARAGAAVLAALSLAALSLAALALGALTLAALTLAARDAAAAAAAPDEGPRHRVRIEGAGPRTVVLESGFGDTLDIWQTIQPRVASHCARTFSYNRAGYLDSDPAVADRDAASIVTELRGELQRRNLPPPYVLVGHSLGGLYMQYFARNFPGEVAGLVLIDSTHWRQGLTVAVTADTPYQSRTAVLLFMPWVMRRELSDSTTAGLEVNGSPSAGAIPTIVLSSTRLTTNQTAEQRSEAVTLQNSIAADFPGARHLYVENSGHYIQRDQPAVVIEAIRDLAGCAP